MPSRNSSERLQGRLGDVAKVHIAKVKGRPFQLRYTDPETGERVRVSTGTYDADEAEKHRKEVAAKLLLGIQDKPRGKVLGPRMSWEEFRHEYTRLKVATFRTENAMETAETRLDLCGRIMRPKTLGQAADCDNLAQLQAELRAGAASQRKRPRSPHTVKGYLVTWLAAINWAYSMHWLPERSRFQVLSTEQVAMHKGRPLNRPEFDRMLEATDIVCGQQAPGWKFLLWGLWESGLRLGEAMLVSWDRDDLITPVRSRSGAVLLRIPAGCQKNGKDQLVPTIPTFGKLLDSIPVEDRTGWVFNPQKMRGTGRFDNVRQLGRVITKIGKAAEVVVSRDGKAASAHDLRRSFGQRMADAGMQIRELQAIMRHASFSTTERYYLASNAADQADKIAKLFEECDLKSRSHMKGSNEKRTQNELS